MKFTIERAHDRQDDCTDCTDWEFFEQVEEAGESEPELVAVQAAANGESGCYRARPAASSGPFAVFRVTGDGVAHRES